MAQFISQCTYAFVLDSYLRMTYRLYVSPANVCSRRPVRRPTAASCHQCCARQQSPLTRESVVMTALASCYVTRIFSVLHDMLSVDVSASLRDVETPVSACYQAYLTASSSV